LFTHRKYFRLGRLIGAPYKAVGVLEMIWNVAHGCGDPIVGKPEDVEFMVGWDGEPGACSAALVESGFLDVLEDGILMVHDLEDHEPEYVKARRRKEDQRRRKRLSRDRDVTVTGQGRDCPPTPSPSPSPSPSPNKEEGTPDKPAQPKTKTEPKPGENIPPTIEEVRERCKEKGYRFNPDRFWHHHNTRGWKLSNGKLMKNWHSACVTFEGNVDRFGGAIKPKPKETNKPTTETKIDLVLRYLREEELLHREPWWDEYVKHAQVNGQDWSIEEALAEAWEFAEALEGGKA